MVEFGHHFGGRELVHCSSLHPNWLVLPRSLGLLALSLVELKAFFLFKSHVLFEVVLSISADLEVLLRVHPVLHHGLRVLLRLLLQVLHVHWVGLSQFSPLVFFSSPLHLGHGGGDLGHQILGSLQGRRGLLSRLLLLLHLPLKVLHVLGIQGSVLSVVSRLKIGEGLVVILVDHLQVLLPPFPLDVVCVRLMHENLSLLNLGGNHLMTSSERVPSHLAKQRPSHFLCHCLVLFL